MLALLNVLQLTRAQKDVMSNCYDQTADVNMFTDTMQIIITVKSLKNKLCDLPQGVLVSLFINGLGSYEPQAYVYDYDYNTSTTFVVNCTDVLCLNLKDSASGQIIIESKSDVVYIPAGSIRISQGHSEDCFYNDNTVAYVMKGGIQFKMYPTPTCSNFITWNDAGVTKLLAPFAARVYINYPDNTMTTHENLAMELTQAVFAPDTIPATALLFTVKNDNISKYFDVKGLKYFTLQLVYKPADILRIVQTNTNQYGLLDLTNVYTSAEIQVQPNGFILKTVPGPNIDAANQKIRDLSSDSYLIYVIMTMRNVSRTFEFRERVKIVQNNTYQFTGQPQPYSCSDYPNQKCAENLKTLMSYKSDEVSVYLAFYFYASTQNFAIMTNYTIGITKISDSCFNGGIADYYKETKSVNVSINLNTKSEYCVLVKDDLLTVKVTDTVSKEVKTLQMIYKAKAIQFSLSNFDLSKNPELQIDISRRNLLEESLRINQYVPKTNSLTGKMMQIVGCIWAANIGCVILYAVWTFWIKQIIMLKRPTQSQLMIKPLEDDF
ncbi:Conserved_hypothetical protein [Hexamita inflata]|uniref:Uncharacterized protein n=1 Tax=Hexamita inflata TaxID=28002 RepID=A0AA86QBE8_9EUKA|nr:Conserved hypothetical protein [Hexamita inflata]